MMSLPFNHGSPTSEEAAVLKQASAASDEERVMCALHGAGDEGLTDDELEARLWMTHQSASARRNGLCHKGLVCDSGRTRLTRSKRRAVVWIIGTPANAPSGPRPERAPRRPSREVLLKAMAEIEQEVRHGRLTVGDPSEELASLLRWLVAVAR